MKTSLMAVSIIAMAMIIGTFSAAYAAEKIVDTKTDVTVFDDQRNVCGLDFVDVERRTISTYTLWDNGHYKSSVKVTKTFTNQETGEIVGTDHTKLSFSGDSDNDESITHWVNNSNTKCKNGGGTITDHFGFNIQKDGTIVFHGEGPDK
jgi:opacity protein-like surface antigen